MAAGRVNRKRSATSVTLVGVDAAIDANDASEITVIARSPSSLGSGDIVITSDTGAVVTLSDGWQYVDASEITQVEPASGQVGSVVSILGERMLGGGDSISRVLLAGTAASIVSGNDTIIVVEAAAASNGRLEGRTFYQRPAAGWSCTTLSAHRMGILCSS